MASKLSSGVSGTGNTAASAGASGSPSKASTSSTTKSSGSSTSSPKVSASSSLSKGVSGSGKTAASSLSSSGGSSGGSSGTRSSTASSKTTNSITSSMSKSLSDSSSATSRSSSEAAKAATVGKNLRGDSASKALSRLDPATVDKLLTYEALQSNFGTPRATIDPAAEEQSLFDLLQSPYERRVERAGGAPFEGPVDWGGIGAAIFGGQSAADRDAAILAARAPAGPRFDPVNPMGGPSWEQFDDYVNNSDAFGPKVDPQTGFIRDPETGTYYRPDMLPGPASGPTRIAEQAPGIALPSFAPLQGLMDGINAEVARTDGSAMPPMPRPDPRGGIAEMGVNLPGQVEGGREPVEIEVRGGNGVESDEAKYAREHPVAAKKEQTVFDKAVEMGGSLLENTALGGIAKNLFPDLWYGTGEAIKGMDDGVTYGGGSAGTNFENMENGGSLVGSQWGSSGDGGGGGYALPPGFVDLNGNGIDDRLEGYQPSTAPNSRVSSFPNMPPYNPGRSDEWTYFTNNRLAGGGIVHAYADGGPVAAEDPRMEVISGAEDVLEKIAAGGKPDERDAAVLKAFVAQFGDGALRSLNDNVKAGMKMGGGSSGGRAISGPGTGTSDSIPALIDGHTPAALSDGEFVMTADAVAGAGGGDPDKGAEALEQLSQRLAGMGGRAA